MGAASGDSETSVKDADASCRPTTARPAKRKAAAAGATTSAVISMRETKISVALTEEKGTTSNGSREAFAQTTEVTTTETTTSVTTAALNEEEEEASAALATTSASLAAVGAQSPSTDLSRPLLSSSSASSVSSTAVPPAPPPSRASSATDSALHNLNRKSVRLSVQLPTAFENAQRAEHSASIESCVTDVDADEDDASPSPATDQTGHDDGETRKASDDADNGDAASTTTDSPPTTTDSPPTKSPTSSSAASPSPASGQQATEQDEVEAKASAGAAVSAAIASKASITPRSSSTQQHAASEDEDDMSVMADILQGHLDRYGFATMDTSRPDGSSTLSMARSRQTYVSKVETLRQRRHRVRLETLRTQKWIRMLDAWPVQLSKKRKRLDRRVRKGVPDCLRDKVWVRLVEEGLKKADVAPPGSAQASAEGLRVDTAFEELLATTNKSSDPEVEKIRECISRDIGRTFPRHVIFHRRGGVGQLALTNVLRAYAALDAEVGYCQGMGFLVGFLLGYLPERRAFHVLRELMLSSPWSMCELYKPGMPGSQLILAQFEALLARYVPDVSKHLEREMIVPSMYATQWFITVFTYNFPFDVVVRVWDIFLFDGWCIVHQVALAILKVNRKALLSRKFEQILEYFRDIPPTLDPQEILNVALTLPVTEKELAAIATEIANPPRR